VETGVASTAIADYVPRGAHCSKAIFEQGGWRAAFEEGIVAS
jgi:hypothetical protein